MKKTTKILALMLCALMLVVGSVMGTLAYLTFTTNEVKNAFTIGKVDLGEDGEGGLDEAKVNEYGEILYVTGKDGEGNPIYTTDKEAVGATIADRVKENQYKLIPNHTYIKDPTIHVLAGSEPCYIFVKVENGIADIEAADIEGEKVTTITGQMAENGWKQLEIEGVVVGNVFYKEEAVDARNADTDYVDIKVFDSFTLAKDKDVSTYKDATITVIAYAIQADGFNSAAEAWSAAPSSWTIPEESETPAEG